MALFHLIFPLEGKTGELWKPERSGAAWTCTLVSIMRTYFPNKMAILKGYMIRGYQTHSIKWTFIEVGSFYVRT